MHPSLEPLHGATDVVIFDAGPSGGSRDNEFQIGGKRTQDILRVVNGIFFPGLELIDALGDHIRGQIGPVDTIFDAVFDSVL